MALHNSVLFEGEITEIIGTDFMLRNRMGMRGHAPVSIRIRQAGRNRSLPGLGSIVRIVGHLIRNNGEIEIVCEYLQVMKGVVIDSNT